MNERPPDWIVAEAVRVGAASPCAKSKRGVVVFNNELEDERYRNCLPVPTGRYPEAIITGRGFNGPPDPMTCDGSDACKRDCSKICLHAEQRAIFAGATLDDVVDLELVHVKVVAGQLVATGGPSCWQCSRLVLEAGLRGVWLYESNETRHGVDGTWKFYTALAFHQVTLKACGLHGGAS